MLKYLRENYDLRDLNCENMKMQMGIQKWNQKKRKTGTIDFNFFFTQSNGVSHFHRVSTCDCDLINYCQIIEQSNADKRWTHEINYQINSIFLDGCLLIKTEYIACATCLKNGERVCVCAMCVYICTKAFSSWLIKCVATRCTNGTRIRTRNYINTAWLVWLKTCDMC